MRTSPETNNEQSFPSLEVRQWDENAPFKPKEDVVLVQHNREKQRIGIENVLFHILKRTE